MVSKEERLGVFPGGRLSSCWFLYMKVFLSVCGEARSNGEVNMVASPGQDVTLPCGVPDNAVIIAAEWSRPDLDPLYVLLYRSKRLDKTKQHPSFKDRVELMDSQLRGGNLSVILRNVSGRDNGRYEVRLKLTTRMKRAVLKSEPVCIINLTVREPGQRRVDSGAGGNLGGHVGLVVGLFMVVMLFTGQTSYLPLG